MYSIFKTERGVDFKNQVLLVNGGQKSMPVAGAELRGASRGPGPPSKHFKF